MVSTIQQVSFKEIRESYFSGVPVECKYSIKSSLVPSGRDWIGLYKVGWVSCDNYDTYLWAQLPSRPAGTPGDAELDGSVTFPADVLPKDSAEFYQFCYVTSSKHVCGVSTPFQFNASESVDDLVEVQDPDDPTAMVIKTKAQILEEQLAAMRKHVLELEKEVQLQQMELDAERTSKGQLMGVMSQLKAELQNEKENKDMMHQQLKDLQDSLQAERHSNEQLHEQLRTLRDSLVTERKAREGERDLQDIEGKENQRDTCSEERNEAVAASAEKKNPGDGEEGNVELENVGATKQAEERASSLAEAEQEKSLSLTERVAGSVLKHLKRASDWFAEDFDDESTTAPAATSSKSSDKKDELLKSCPVCNEDFVDKMTESEIEEHVEKHNGQVCPICYMQFDQDYPEENVTAHVNRHLDCVEENLF